ncbi:MAG: Heimdall-CTERM domain-containing surface protein [Candidatus Hodarchaeales archaeon]|jgi:hypothetical protein
MKKTYLLAMVFGFALLLSSIPISAKSAADETVVVDIGQYDYDDLEHFLDTLEDWGYTVTEHNSTKTEYSSTVLTGADVLVLPALTKNLSSASVDAIAAWFEGGSKNLWVSGDSDYGDENATKAASFNRVLEAIDANIFVEATSIESDTNFGAAYRVRPTLYSTTTEAAKLVMDAPHTSSEFHGPAAVIGKNSTGHYIAIEDTQPTDVEVVIKTATNSIVNKKSAASGSIYGIHDQGDEGSFVMMALQTFTGGSKLVVTGESIFSDYKHMFEDPGELGIPQDDAYIVYNTFLWFTGGTRDTTVPTITSISSFTLTSANNATEWVATDTGSGICSFDIYLDDVYHSSQSVAKTNFSANVNESTSFNVKARDYAANVSEFLPVPTPGFGFLALLGSIGIIAVIRRRKK